MSVHLESLSCLLFLGVYSNFIQLHATFAGNSRSNYCDDEVKEENVFVYSDNLKAGTMA